MTSIFRFVAATAISCAALLSPLVTSAVPAYPGLLKMTQPDGTEINVQLRGDEYHHITLTEDGYLLTKQNGGYYYADVTDRGEIIASPYLAKTALKRTAAERNFLSTVNMDRVFEVMTQHRDAVVNASNLVNKIASPAAMVEDRAVTGKGYGLFPGSSFPVTGKQKGLVILVEYTDVKFNSSYDPQDYFSRMLNEDNFSTYGGTGSAHEFFYEVSDGKFDIDFDVYGPVTLDHEQAYYGGNDTNGNDKNPWRMVVEGCQKLEDQVDFTQYDRDGDGKIDNVFVFYAGMGEASGGSDDTVWPHASQVAYFGKYSVDGVQIDRYACSNEWEIAYRDGARPDGVGTFVHEFSHVMGLPDLYATGYSSSFTPGAWSCMDVGPYNNEGRTPPLYGLFERNALGWLEPEEISGPFNGKLRSIGTGDGYIINTTRAQEFFLLENRQQVSWDTYIPGNGMLIWHILYNSSIWNSNVVNNTPTLQYVDIEEADNIQSEATRVNDAFPGRMGQYTSFTDDTKPSMLTWQNKSLGLPITNIVLENGVITFKVAGGVPNVASTEALESKDITPGGFTAVWKASEEAGVKYAVTVYTKTQDNTPVFIDGLLNVIVDGTTFTTDDLEPSTQYYWNVKVYSPERDEYSYESNELSFTTLEATLAYMRPELKDASAITDSGFTMSWLPFDGAESYLVNVYTKTPLNPDSIYSGFDKFVTPTYYVDDEWSTNSTENYTNAKYAGQSVPSVKMTKDGIYIQTPVVIGSVQSVSFWQRGVTVNDQNTILVQAGINGVWSDVCEAAISYATSGELTTITGFPPLTNQVRLVFNRKVTGSLAIDDVTVRFSQGYENTPVEGYKDLNVGNVTSFDVTGLNPETTYGYTVAAIKDNTHTRDSYEGIIYTSVNTAVDFIGSDSKVDYTLAGNLLTAGESLTVYDTLGRAVTSLVAGSSRTLAPGVYLVRTATGSARIAVL